VAGLSGPLCDEVANATLYATTIAPPQTTVVTTVVTTLVGANDTGSSTSFPSTLIGNGSSTGGAVVTTSAATLSASSRSTSSPATTGVPRNITGFLRILNQAWIDNNVGQTFSVSQYDSRITSFVANAILSDSGFMLTFNHSRLEFRLRRCLSYPDTLLTNVTLSDALRNSVSINGTLTVTSTTTTTPFPPVTFFNVSINATNTSTMINGTNTSWVLGNGTNSSSNGSYVPSTPEPWTGPPGVHSFEGFSIELFVLVNNAANASFVLFSMETDAAGSTLFTVLLTQTSVTVQWGFFAWTASVQVPVGVWTFLAITWRRSDGLLTVYVRPNNGTLVTDSVSNVLAGCQLMMMGTASVGQPIGGVARGPLVVYTVVDFAGSLDSLRIYTYTRSLQEIVDATLTYSLVGSPGLLVDFAFDNTRMTAFGQLIGSQFPFVPVALPAFAAPPNGSIPLNPSCPLLAFMLPALNPPTFQVSSAPINVASEEKCVFYVEGLEEQAYELCDLWFYSGNLNTSCHSLGPEVLFYHEACICDIAKYSDLAAHKPSVCMFASHCSQLGVGASGLLDDYCDGVGLAEASTGGRRWFVWVMMVCTFILMFFMLLWYIIMYFHTKRRERQREREAKRAQERKKDEMDIMDYEGQDAAFENQMFGMNDPALNALYMQETALTEPAQAASPFGTLGGMDSSASGAPSNGDAAGSALGPPPPMTAMAPTSCGMFSPNPFRPHLCANCQHPRAKHDSDALAAAPPPSSPPAPVPTAGGYMDFFPEPAPATPGATGPPPGPPPAEGLDGDTPAIDLAAFGFGSPDDGYLWTGPAETTFADPEPAPAGDIPAGAFGDDGMDMRGMGGEGFLPMTGFDDVPPGAFGDDAVPLDQLGMGGKGFLPMTGFDDAGAFGDDAVPLDAFGGAAGETDFNALLAGLAGPPS